jgi:shikimate kinase
LRKQPPFHIHDERIARQLERMSAPPCVVLVGFMGAGKTSVGRELARRLGWRFVDLDDEIVAAERRSIAEIFEKSGEPAFRAAESRALASLLAGKPERLVLALGGGAFAQEENAAGIRAAGLPVVFLDATLETLRARCAEVGATRPLFREAERFRRLYHERRPAYAKATHEVSTEAKDVAGVAAEIAKLLHLEPK